MPTRDSELDRIRESVAAQLVRRAGLRGAYESADCELGRRLHRQAEAGVGAYLWGGCGTGKTYAAACAVRLCVEAGGKARLVTAKRLLDEVKDGYDGGERDAIRRYASLDLLALDDLGAERATPWSVGELTDLVDERVAGGLPTIVTSNFRLGELRDIWGGVEGRRLASRIAGACGIVEVSGPDRRLGGMA